MLTFIAEIGGRNLVVTIPANKIRYITPDDTEKGTLVYVEGANIPFYTAINWKFFCMHLAKALGVEEQTLG